MNKKQISKNENNVHPTIRNMQCGLWVAEMQLQRKTNKKCLQFVIAGWRNVNAPTIKLIFPQSAIHNLRVVGCGNTQRNLLTQLLSAIPNLWVLDWG